MSRPSFQFYHGDWISNAKLRRCTHEEKGAWIDVLCLMADSDEFGILRWNLKEIADAVHCKPGVLQALIRKGVLKGADEDGTCEAYVYTSRSGRKMGIPVTLIPEQKGPIWYSSKQVRDEHVTRLRALGGATKGGNLASPKDGGHYAPKATSGEGQGANSPSPTPSPTPIQTPNPSSALDPPQEAGTRRGAVAAMLRAAGVEITSQDPRLMEWTAAEVTDEQLHEAIERARLRKPAPERIPGGYFAPILREVMARRATVARLPAKRSSEPDFSKINYREGIADDGSF